MIKKILFAVYIVLIVSFSSCSTGNDITTSNTSDYTCGLYNGHQLWTRPKGGYYYNSNNSKTYIDRSICNCK